METPLQGGLFATIPQESGNQNHCLAMSGSDSQRAVGIHNSQPQFTKNGGIYLLWLNTELKSKYA
jgi:hypothetical protein